MAATAFDTLKFAQTLRDKAHFTTEQAEAISEAFATATSEEMVTKSHLDARLHATQAHLDAKLNATQAHLDAKLHAMQTHLEAQLAATKAQLGAQIEATKAHADVRIEAVKSEIIKWLFGTIVAQTGLIIAAVKLLH